MTSIPVLAFGSIIFHTRTDSPDWPPWPCYRSEVIWRHTGPTARSRTGSPRGLETGSSSHPYHTLITVCERCIIEMVATRMLALLLTFQHLSVSVLQFYFSRRGPRMTPSVLWSGSASVLRCLVSVRVRSDVRVLVCTLEIVIQGH
ncbi:hypothetical protein L798_07499 [Zootermopsis nevadensis]|uniref:Uncharacterized protein n=1 Tax=Zootermopsis nevadensis TaxID=136037 RepID=A0A067R5X9_ZOONE|nr:hypothetical protein L798_07499 [Zootermopsis nevadensis]